MGLPYHNLGRVALLTKPGVVGQFGLFSWRSAPAPPPGRVAVPHRLAKADARLVDSECTRAAGAAIRHQFRTSLRPQPNSGAGRNQVYILSAFARRNRSLDSKAGIAAPRRPGRRYCATAIASGPNILYSERSSFPTGNPFENQLAAIAKGMGRVRAAVAQK